MGNHLFVIFAVLDVSFAVNSCLNRGFFTFSTVTAKQPSTASVPITVLLYDGPLFCGFNVAIKGLILAIEQTYKTIEKAIRSLAII